MLSKNFDVDFRTGFAKTKKGIATPVGVNAFRFSELGKKINEANPKNNHAIFEKVSVLKSPEQMYSKKALESLRGIPITEGHPVRGTSPELLNTKNTHLIKGWITDYKIDSNNDLRISYLIVDEELMKKVNSGELRQFSWGINFEKLQKEDGVFNGQKYQYKIINPTYNHLAICKMARGGEKHNLQVFMNKDDGLFESSGLLKYANFVCESNNENEQSMENLKKILEKYEIADIEKTAKEIESDVTILTESEQQRNETTVVEDELTELKKCDRSKMYFEEIREKIKKENEEKITLHKVVNNALAQASEILKGFGKDFILESELSYAQDSSAMRCHTHLAALEVEANIAHLPIDKKNSKEKNYENLFTNKITEMIGSSNAIDHHNAKLGFIYGVASAMRRNQEKQEVTQVTTKQKENKHHGFKL